MNENSNANNNNVPENDNNPNKNNSNKLLNTYNDNNIIGYEINANNNENNIYDSNNSFQNKNNTRNNDIILNGRKLDQLNDCISTYHGFKNNVLHDDLSLGDLYNFNFVREMCKQQLKVISEKLKEDCAKLLSLNVKNTCIFSRNQSESLKLHKQFTPPKKISKDNKISILIKSVNIARKKPRNKVISKMRLEIAGDNAVTSSNASEQLVSKPIQFADTYHKLEHSKYNVEHEIDMIRRGLWFGNRFECESKRRNSRHVSLNRRRSRHPEIAVDRNRTVSQHPVLDMCEKTFAHFECTRNTIIFKRDLEFSLKKRNSIKENVRKSKTIEKFKKFLERVEKDVKNEIKCYNKKCKINKDQSITIVKSKFRFKCVLKYVSNYIIRYIYDTLKNNYNFIMVSKHNLKRTQKKNFKIMKSINKITEKVGSLNLIETSLNLNTRDVHTLHQYSINHAEENAKQKRLYDINKFYLLSWLVYLRLAEIKYVHDLAMNL